MQGWLANGVVLRQPDHTLQYAKGCVDRGQPNTGRCKSAFSNYICTATVTAAHWNPAEKAFVNGCTRYIHSKCGHKVLQLPADESRRWSAFSGFASEQQLQQAPIAQACPQVYAVAESNDSAGMVQDWLDSSSADGGGIELANSRDRARREIEPGSARPERPAQRPRLAHDIPSSYDLSGGPARPTYDVVYTEAEFEDGEGVRSHIPILPILLNTWHSPATYPAHSCGCVHRLQAR